MCTGSQKIKANFLYDTLRYLSKDTPRIDEEMQYVFGKLMVISLNLPSIWHQSAYEQLTQSNEENLESFEEWLESIDFEKKK